MIRTVLIVLASVTGGLGLGLWVAVMFALLDKLGHKQVRSKG